MAIYIYGLECPIENSIRYIGKSTNPASRFKCHVEGARKGSDQYKHRKSRWIRKLLKEGLEPRLVILHEVREWERWQDIERSFIASAIERGLRLTNVTAGGEGLDYLDPKDEARYRANLKKGQKEFNATPRGRARLRKMVDAALEPEALARRNAAIRQAYKDPELKKKMSEVNREIGSRPDVKKSKSDKFKSKWNDQEHRDRWMAAFSKPDVKAKQSAAKKASWSDPVVGAKLRAIHSSEEVRRKKSEAAKRRNTPEYRDMMAEKTSLSWQKRKAIKSGAENGQQEDVRNCTDALWYADAEGG